VGLLRSVFVRWHRRACLLAKGKEHQKGPGGYTGSSVNDWFNKALNLYLQSIAYTGITTTIKCFSYNILAATDVVAAIFCFSYNKML